MRRGLVAGALALLVAFAAACSSGPSGDLTADAARRLGDQVQQVRVAVASGDRPRAVAAIEALKQMVRREQQSGGVSATRANYILDAADALESDLPKPTPSPTSESPTPAPSPTTQSPTPTPTPTPTTPSPTPPPATTPPPVSPTNGGGGGGGGGGASVGPSLPVGSATG